jgi:hypothetical protein
LKNNDSQTILLFSIFCFLPIVELTLFLKAFHLLWNSFFPSFEDKLIPVINIIEWRIEPAIIVKKNHNIEIYCIPFPDPPKAEGIVCPNLPNSVIGALTPPTIAVIGPPHIPT